MTDTDIEHLARAIRLMFLEEKGRQLGRKFKPHPTHDQMKFFVRAAMQVKELEADPMDYVQAAIKYCGVPKGPFANQLGGQAAKNWYIESLEARGIDPGKLRKQRPQEMPDAPPVYDVVFACDADLQMDVEIGLCILRLNTGSEDCSLPENLKILRNPVYEMPIAARALLGFHDEQVMTLFAAEIFDYFKTQPNYYAAAERAGYPIQEIVQWTHKKLLQTS